MPRAAREVIGVGFVLTALLASGCNASANFPGVPTEGQVPVGVSYRMLASCPSSFVIGDELWEFDSTVQWPPDQIYPWTTVRSNPYDVPGVLTLRSRTEGVFVADVDGSSLGIHYIGPYPSEDW